jgi:hypothetical protein
MSKRLKIKKCSRRARMPRRRVDSKQLQLYIKILLFYMTVVYFCMLHVQHAATHVRKSEARLSARLASELRVASKLRVASELRVANLTALVQPSEQSQKRRLWPLRPAPHEIFYAKT